MKRGENFPRIFERSPLNEGLTVFVSVIFWRARHREANGFHGLAGFFFISGKSHTKQRNRILLFVGQTWKGERTMGIREEIKSYIVRSGMTMTEVVDRLYDDYDGAAASPIYLANCVGVPCDTKKPWSLRMCWTMTLSGSSVNGKEVQWHKKHSTQFYALPNTRRGRQGHWKPTTSAQRRSTPAIPILTSDKSKDNFHIIQPTQKYRKEIDTRIKAAGCRTRKDSTMFVDTLITASPEFFTGRSKKEVQAYFTEAVAFMEKKVGRGNIFSAVVHMDEKTPHLHLCFTPITVTGGCPPRRFWAIGRSSPNGRTSSTPT